MRIEGRLRAALSPLVTVPQMIARSGYPVCWTVNLTRGVARRYLSGSVATQTCVGAGRC